MKKVLAWSAIALASFYLITNPSDAAGAVRGVFAFLGNAANAAIAFLGAVFS